MFKCSKSVYHASTWILFFIAIFILPCFAFNCIHDKVNVQKQRSAVFTRSVKYQDVKAERDRDPKFFEPLDVHFDISVTDPSVNLDTIYNIELALGKVKTYIQKVIEVKKRKRPYLLIRNACVSNWRTGKHKGRCASFTKDPEVCDSKGIRHVIPDMYLDGLTVFENNKGGPSYTVNAGPGLSNSNFITFVTIQRESMCEMGAVAFGTFCRLDRKTNEPLAGILNFCPDAFSGKSKRLQYYYNVILHEMFHILGFSVKSFEKFVPCEKGIYCNAPQNVFQEDSSGISRMMYPLVIENTQKHFGCLKADFGGPMAMKEEENASLDYFPYTSHWHPVLMHSSIMTPSFSEYEEVFVDNITLAMFASIGWYHVNFSYAENFLFGSGEGCDFGMNDTCNSTYLCDPSKENYGCDLYHKSISKCESVISSHPCGVYVPHSEGDCETKITYNVDLDRNSLGYKRKCFVLEESESESKPVCLPIKCRSEFTYGVLINMTWYTCFLRSQVSSQNFSFFCPDSDSFCSDLSPPEPPQSCPSDSNFFVAVRMYFDKPTFQDLSANHHFKNFKVTAVRTIAEKIEIPVNFIVNATLSVFKQIYLDFAICAPPEILTADLFDILNRVQKFLDGNFIYILKGPTDKLISSTNILIDPVDVIRFSDRDGFRALLIFPVICAIFLIATFLASIFRLHLLQKHRPRRVVENPNIELSDVNSS